MHLDQQYSSLLERHGLKESDGRALAGLFANKLEIGQPYYSDIEPGHFSNAKDFIVLEVGFKNDHNRSLALFDQFMSEFPRSCPCGLSREFRFSTEVEYQRFMLKFQDLLLLGWYAAWDKECPGQE